MSDAIKAAVTAALVAGNLSAATLPQDECPIPNFDELKASLHDAICSVNKSSFTRDAALLEKLQAAEKQIEAMDPGNVSETIATIQAFIDNADKDKDGNIDGLATLIQAVDNLTLRVKTLEDRAATNEQQVATLGQQVGTLGQTQATQQQQINELQNRENKAGISKDESAALAAELVCSAVLKPLQAAVADLNTAVQAINCGAEDHTAFMDALAANEPLTLPSADSGTADAGAADAGTGGTIGGLGAA